MKLNFKLLSIIFVSAALVCFNINAQESNESNEPTEQSQEENEQGGGPTESTVLDGAYEQIGVKERGILAYDHIREADVLWAKRLWRVIDTREKMNMSFTNEKEPFISVLMEVVENNPEIPLFMDDGFEDAVTWEDVKVRLNQVDTIEVLNPDTYEYEQTVVENDFNPKEIEKFRIKEDWIFDEETSTMVCRIIGLAPIQDVYDDNDNYRGQAVMFWVHYPSMREYLCKYAAVNPFNDLQVMTWEDVFEQRHFSSYIMKESNPKDERISDYAQGRDALWESEKIRDKVFKKEHDLWSF